MLKPAISSSALQPLNKLPVERDVNVPLNVIFFAYLQFLKVSEPTLVNVSGKMISIAEQQANPFPEIVVILVLDKSKTSPSKNFLTLPRLKSCVPISLNSVNSERLTYFKEVQFLKFSPFISTIQSGKYTYSRLVEPVNTFDIQFIGLPI